MNWEIWAFNDPGGKLTWMSKLKYGCRGNLFCYCLVVLAQGNSILTLFICVPELVLSAQNWKPPSFSPNYDNFFVPLILLQFLHMWNVIEVNSLPPNYISLIFFMSTSPVRNLFNYMSNFFVNNWPHSNFLFIFSLTHDNICHPKFRLALF